MPNAGGVNLLTHPHGWIATGLGAGLFPRAPGTFASAIACVLCWPLADLPQLVILILFAVIWFVGVRASNWVVQISQQKDPSRVVIDEWLGQWLTIYLLSVFLHLGSIAIGQLALLGTSFGLFRLFDIVKPWPVSWADQRVSGGIGIMLDDVLAAVYAALFGFAGFWLWEVAAK